MKFIDFVDLVNMTDEEINELSPINQIGSKYGLSIYVELGHFQGIVASYDVTLDDLRDQLTHLIKDFLSKYPDGRPCTIPPSVRFEGEGDGRQRVAISVDYS